MRKAPLRLERPRVAMTQPTKEAKRAIVPRNKTRKTRKKINFKQLSHSASASAFIIALFCFCSVMSLSPDAVRGFASFYTA
jgi:hypothetical protein